LHELGVATQIADMVTRVVREHSATKAGEITVEIGVLSCIDAASLEFCFDAITKGTGLEGARLKIEKIDARAKCRTCGTEYTVRPDDFRCRTCGSGDFDMIAGREISVKEVEVE
jgi:hydrogenase nickel incorporation protein HypA/HybF